jgi:transcriptional regulator GlxA family with amidase domain
VKEIGILVFDDVEELDFVGPLEVFGVAAQVGADCRVVILAENLEPVRCTHGLRVLPERTFDQAGALDFLIVPGDAGARLAAAKNPRILKFIQAQRGFVASVCTGAFVLAAAGVLQGLAVTTHHQFFDALVEQGVDVQRNKRWIIHDAVGTAAGVTSGIDLALALVARFWGDDLARRVADDLEWEK